MPKNIDQNGATSYTATLGVPQRPRSSIDATQYDGFLQSARDAYSGAAISIGAHSNFSEAFANLQAGAGDFSIIVGHGQPGQINTGCGDASTGAAPQTFISLSNQAQWLPCAAEGIVGSHLVLFGCQVGCGPAGASLLQGLANAINKPVGAWAGYCWGDEGASPKIWGTGTFLTANPGQPLQPIPAVNQFQPNRSGSLKLRWRTTGRTTRTCRSKRSPA